MSENKENFYDGGKPLSMKDIGKIKQDELNVMLPCASYEQINTYIDTLKINKNSIQDMDSETIASIKDTENSLQFLNKNDIGSRLLVNGLSNKIIEDGKSLRLKSLEPKGKSSSSIKLSLYSKLSIGKPAHVPLWHSGFWVSITPLTKAEKINLQLEISHNIETIGKETHNLIYSNHSVLFAKILVDVLRNKIIDTSLSLPEGADIFDYIKVQDLDILIWGLLKTMYPRGTDYIIYCKNSAIIENNAPKCTYKLKLKLDLEELHRVDTDRIKQSEIEDTDSINHIQHMLKRSHASVTTDEVKLYQDTLTGNNEDTISIDADGTNTSLVLKTPFINEYLVHGDNYVNELKSKIEELYTSGILEKDDDEAVKLIIDSIVLKMYSHYIKSINVDGKVVEELKDLDDAIEILSGADEYKDKLLNSIIKYIDNSLISIIGIPTFTCPTCKESQTEQDSNNKFKSFIGLNTYMYFFTLLAFQYQKAMRALNLK